MTTGETIAPKPPKPAEIDALDRPTLLIRYRDAIDRFDPRVFELEHEDSERTFSPGSGLGLWSCRALMNHLADAEVVFTHRIRRTLAEESPMLALWDHEAFMGSPLYGAGGEKMTETPFEPVMAPLGALAATLHTLRLWGAAVLFQLDDAGWQRRAMHPERGSFGLDEMVRFTTWHVEHHAAFLNTKVEAILGPRPEACDDAPRGGCGPGCGCAGG